MFCTSCGAQLQSGAAFCSGCGAKVSGSPAAAPQPQVPKPPPMPGAALRPQYFRQREKKSDRAGILIAIIFGGFVFVAILGIIAAIAIPNFLAAIQRAKQKRTMADMRNIATALEVYYGEKGKYPEAASIEELSKMLQPKYVNTMPTIDAWEHEFRYTNWMENSSPRYAIGSAGKDGVWEKTDLRSYVSGSRESYDADIILVSGIFVQQPDTSASPALSSTPAKESVTPGPPIPFPQFNFSFQTPPKPWAQMDAAKVNKDSTLAYIRMHPQVLFFLIAEKIPGGTLDTAALAEISKGNLKSAASSVAFLEEGSCAIGNKNGVRFVTKANLGGRDMLYVHCVYSEGTYAYQLITAGELEDQQAIKQEANKMISYFSLSNL
jgi:general secretion pathway protein G